MKHPNEIDYIKRILDGETNLFSYFLSHYGNAIFSLIVRIMPSKEDAEELTQDTFIKAFNKLDSFKGDCSFSTWLFRIAYNTAVSATRKVKMDVPAIDDAMLSRIPNEDTDRLFEDDGEELLLQRLEAALQQLNTEERTLITLYYTEEKSVGDIASIMALSNDNVKIKLYRTRKKLYVLIKKDDDYDTR